MNALVMLYFLVAPVPVESSFPAIALGSTQPVEGGFYLYGGSLYGVGGGWKFGTAANTIEIDTKGFRRISLLTDTEYVRVSLVSGISRKVQVQIYLGHGFAYQADSARMSLVWYPYEFLTFSYGLDLSTGRFGGGWQIHF